MTETEQNFVNIIGEQRNQALNSLANLQVDLIECNKKIAKLEAQLAKSIVEG